MVSTFDPLHIWIFFLVPFFVTVDFVHLGWTQFWNRVKPVSQKVKFSRERNGSARKICPFQTIVDSDLIGFFFELSCDLNEFCFPFANKSIQVFDVFFFLEKLKNKKILRAIHFILSGHYFFFHCKFMKYYKTLNVVLLFFKVIYFIVIIEDIHKFVFLSLHNLNNALKEACRKYTTLTAERLRHVDPIPLIWNLQTLKKL